MRLVWSYYELYCALATDHMVIQKKNVFYVHVSPNGQYVREQVFDRTTMERTIQTSKYTCTSFINWEQNEI